VLETQQYTPAKTFNIDKIFSVQSTEALLCSLAKAFILTPSAGV
jgi:hypothetical protein